LLSQQLADSMNEKQKRFLRNIQEAGDHLLDLINDVLDLSKVEAGRLDLRPEIVTLDALLEPVSAAARTAAQAKGVLFTIETPEAPSLFVDPTRVRQVLFNLVSNAVKFTSGGGHVTLRTLVQDRDLRFEVADTGGFPAEGVRSPGRTAGAPARGRPLRVLLDLRLTGGRGEQFLGRLRTDPALADVPVIVVTVEADPATTLALGADDYLTKPI